MSGANPVYCNTRAPDDGWGHRNSSLGAFATSLAKAGGFLRVADSKKQKRWGLGHYYIVGPKGVVDKDVNIEKLARQLGLLDPWETLENNH